ncbi:coiled-coil domain-containing protein 78-like isoform X2 [Littorina saxatilis]|uniref:Kinesin motor domain-containing protein n=1 Tax=Littorina saxatilis TaxID=31220 RepID=A0AAN9G9K4_9CAEN
MNIDVVGRMRPMTRVEGATNLLVEANGRVAAHAGGPYFGFQTLHSSNTSTYDVFKTSVEALLDLYLAGYNVCLLIGGESGAGKSYNMVGETNNRPGLVQMVLDHLFAKLSEERYHPQTRMSKQDPEVTMEMVEVYNELVKDLMSAPHALNMGLLDITESAVKGVHAKNATTTRVSNASMGGTYFRNAWGRRTEATTDHGPASQNAAIILHIDLCVKVGDNPQPYKSRFTIVELPGLEKLSADPTQVQLREGPKLSKALIALSQVTTSLANHPFPDRVIHYGDSKLTQLLQEQLGGNFKTRALICLKAKTDPDISNGVLKFCTNLSHIRNFPIVNDGLAQGLLVQKEARILEHKQQSGSGPVHFSSTTAPVYNDTGEEIRRLQTENLVLKDQNERLQLRLDRLQNKFGDIANTRTDLSQQLLLSEEEKLKVSQSLVDIQIENNKIREEAEAAKFELTNKIILLENHVLELEAERDKHKKSATYAKERLAEVEKDRKDLADEYVVLKTNYLALTKEHQKELARNEELAIELLNLVNNKAALMRQVAILTNGDPETSEANSEIDRIRALVAKNSGGKIKAGDIIGNQTDRDHVEQTLFANRKKYDIEIERMRRELADENKKMEHRLTAVMKELAENRNLARERQQKISELNAKLITIRGEKESLQTQLNRLQHKAKDLGEDFRARLIKYVEDIAEFVDKGQANHPQNRLRDYCDGMLKDIRRSHKEREAQLSEAARGYKERMAKTIHSYEALLIAYRNLRQTCEARGFDKADLGPDEYEMKLSDSEIQSAHMKELDRVKSELARTKNETDTLKMRYGLFGEDKDTMAEITVAGKSDIWGAMRKQLREFTLNTQQQLEQERARLLSENSVLKEQLRESQQYIDGHLVRYKQEVVRLRKMLGMNEDGVILTDRVGRSLRTRRR